MSEFTLGRLPVGYLARPERTQRPPSALERGLRHLAAPFAARLGARDGGRARFLRRLAGAEAACRELSAEALVVHITGMRRRLLATGFAGDGLAEALGVLRVCAHRTLGLRPHDEQLLGARLLLRGRLAEMATGEGKSLTAALAAACAALAGVPVHLVTVNDYLATRDAEELTPFYRLLGIRVGCATLEADEATRRTAWACDVTYCDSKVLVFDYLRDQLRLGAQRDGLGVALRGLSASDPAGGLLLRGLHFALVDEADSVLIDEARTPLTLSGPAGDDGSEPVYRAALSLARQLREGEHFTWLPGRGGGQLTAAGEVAVERLSAGWEGLWRGRRRRQALALQALTALHRLRPDRDYLVQDDKVQIIDPHTGRVLPDRQWSQGLQQLVEIKEGLEPSRANRTLAKISYQRFFRRYHHLCGLSGTAREVATELWRVYGLAVARVPTHRPVQRRRLPPRVFARSEARWDAVVARLEEWHAQDKAVLVGCDSVAASETLSRRLAERGLPHRVLNARQSREEAELVARAGQPGSITVTTQMAGRGTDIRIAGSVRENGGVHVLLTACQEARRIDRQLEGRCARQGDPGTVQYLLSWEDALVRQWRLRWLALRPGGGVPACC